MAATSKRALLTGAGVVCMALALIALSGLHGTVDVSEAIGDVPPGTQRFALCRSNVGSFGAFPTPGGVAPFAIGVQLEPAASEEFARVTGENPGQTLEVVFGEWLFLRAPIERGIRSGTLVHQAFASAEEAEGAVRQLREQLPESPCGIQAKDAG